MHLGCQVKAMLVKVKETGVIKDSGRVKKYDWWFENVWRFFVNFTFEDVGVKQESLLRSARVGVDKKL